MALFPNPEIGVPLQKWAVKTRVPDKHLFAVVISTTPRKRRRRNLVNRSVLDNLLMDADESLIL